MSTGPALGLGHLGHRLGAPTRERPSNFGAKFDIFKKNKKIKTSFTFFFSLILRSFKEWSNAKDNTTLNT